MATQHNRKAKPSPKPVRNHHGNSGDFEVLDPTPMEMPVGCSVPTPLNELVARFVATELAKQTDTEPESYEEANDFEDDGDDLLLDMSPYELQDLTPEDDEAPLEAQEPPGIPPHTPPPVQGEEQQESPPEAPETP